jgi:hypothetical protein
VARHTRPFAAVNGQFPLHLLSYSRLQNIGRILSSDF